jgi:hypothetical protein
MCRRLIAIAMLGSLCVSMEVARSADSPASSPSNAESGPNSPQRDPRAIDILNRTLKAAGGMQALSGIHNFTESGGITLYFAEEVKGPVLIRSLGGNYFRMDASVPGGKRSWTLSGSHGSRRESSGKEYALTDQSAVDLANLSFPLAYVTAAVLDPQATIAFRGVEDWKGRSVYRIQLKGKLGVVDRGILVRDLLVDAIGFDILVVEDEHLRIHKPGEKPTDLASRQIEFGDFRVASGIRVPYWINTRFMGQQVMRIELNQIAFNGQLSNLDFGQ